MVLAEGANVQVVIAIVRHHSSSCMMAQRINISQDPQIQNYIQTNKHEEEHSDTLPFSLTHCLYK